VAFVTKFVIKRVERVAGPMTEKGSMFKLGKSRLGVDVILDATAEPTRHCRVATWMSGEYPEGCIYAGVKDADGRWWTLGDVIAEFMTRAAVRLGPGREYEIRTDDAGRVEFRAVALRSSYWLPPALQPLGLACLRGELEPDLLLDAIKHETEILG